jgi:hypothetical protein
VQASCLEPTSVAEEPAGGHEHGLHDSEQEQRANLVCHGDVGVTAAVRVLLFRIRDDDGRALVMLGGYA